MKNDRVCIFDEVGIKRFAQCLKIKRKAMGFTQEKLAYESNITLSQIARIETAKINPRLSTIFQICRTLQIEPQDLFEEMHLLD